MSYLCSVCKLKVDGDLLVYVSHTEEHIAATIKAKHPEWKESEGICKPCLDYYYKQMRGDHSSDGFWSKAQCSARRSKILNFLRGVFNK